MVSEKIKSQASTNINNNHMVKYLILEQMIATLQLKYTLLLVERVIFLFLEDMEIHKKRVSMPIDRSSCNNLQMIKYFVNKTPIAVMPLVLAESQPHNPTINSVLNNNSSFRATFPTLLPKCRAMLQWVHLLTIIPKEGSQIWRTLLILIANRHLAKE